MIDSRRFRLFVCGSLLPGEPDAALLEGAVALGPVRTAARYGLVDLGANAVLLAGLTLEVPPVVGELYEVTAQTLARCDVKHEHPTLFVRDDVELEDGTVALDRAREDLQLAVGSLAFPGGAGELAVLDLDLVLLGEAAAVLGLELIHPAAALLPDLVRGALVRVRAAAVLRRLGTAPVLGRLGSATVLRRLGPTAVLRRLGSAPVLRRLDRGLAAEVAPGVAARLHQAVAHAAVRG